MKHSVLICAMRKPALLHRVVRILYWQGVEPDMLQCQTMGSGTVQIRVIVECDAWNFQCLVVQWEVIAGVQSLVTLPLDDNGTSLPGKHLAPAAR
jgi:acetolactate synthase regulatory subunit